MRICRRRPLNLTLIEDIAMVSSDRFLKLVRQLHKERELAPEEREERLRGYFFTSMRDLPENLCYDLFDHWSAKAADDPDRKTFDWLAERLGILIDLFQGDYDDAGDLLEPDEWDFVRDAVSESAAEMDVETLTYVMQHIVERGRI